MKKRIFVTFFILSLLIFQASALQINSDKQSYNQGETFIATLQGNILEPINKEDVGFYEGHVQKPFDYGILKIGDIYYIYAVLPYSEKNYNLKIQDVYFKENNEFKTETLQFNFTISNLTSDFNVKPGAIISNKNFTIELYNNLNSQLSVNYEFEGKQFNVNLPSQELKKITINTDSIFSTKSSTLAINTANTQYSIPIQIIKSGTAPNPEDPEIKIPINENGSEIRFSISAIDETLKPKQTYGRKVLLKNIGNNNTGKITLTASKELKDLITFETPTINNLIPQEEIEVKFLINPKIIGEFEGYILADSKESNDKIGVILNIGEDVEIISSIKTKVSCAELQGTICSQGLICRGVIQSSLDVGACCIGKCKEAEIDTPKKTNNVAIIIVLVLLLGIIVFIGIRMKKSKISKDPIKERANISKTSYLFY